MNKREIGSNPLRVGIIGGGIAGSTAAIKMSELGFDIALFDRKSSLVYGPPICHLHAGGNLYREISEAQCKDLLKQSIQSVKLYPHTINIRPTVIAIPKSDQGEPDPLISRLGSIQRYYQQLVEQDATNEVLGEPKQYFKLYQKKDLERLKGNHQSAGKLIHDDWMVPFANHVDLETIKYPVVLVQEYGWSLFRLAASTQLMLSKFDNAQLYLSTEVTGIEKRDKTWVISFVKGGHKNSVEVDYLINACGFETGTLDNWVDAPKNRLVEFKAAYIARWNESVSVLWPEVIFHGVRGTVDGMAQLTPYANGVFQLHGMTDEITLFKDGLATNDLNSSQPHLPDYLLTKIRHGWTESQLNLRTQLAIKHISRYIPSFNSATVAGKPLFGAQQVPGNDITLRASDVSFAGGNYARMEIVKGSSAIEASLKIINDMKTNYELSMDYHFDTVSLSPGDVETSAIKLASVRGYPAELAMVSGEQELHR